MVTIIFEAHATTLDNEAHRSSGHNDVALSPAGEQQARQLGERYKDAHFDAIYCSDLQRSYKTGEIAFGNRDVPVIRDTRLRECDYGELTEAPNAEVDPEKPKHISVPFPGGESYEQTAQRMGNFLRTVSRDRDGQTIMIIGHRATQYGLEHWIKEVTVEQAVTAQWKWQPGWTYHLEKPA